MQPSQKTLSERHAQLVARCAAERARAGGAMASIKGQLAGADRGMESARRWIRNPVVIAAGVALMVAVGRSLSLRGAGAVLGLLSTGLKARGIAQSMREIQARRAPGP